MTEYKLSLAENLDKRTRKPPLATPPQTDTT